jgi:glucokinase
LRRRKLRAPELHVWSIFEAARAQNQWAREVVRITGEHLGIAIGILLNTLNPSYVALGGGGAGGFDVLEPHIRGAVARHAFRETAAAATIERARLANDAGMVGAAMLVRDTIGQRHKRR